MMELLIKCGVNVDHQDSDGITALIGASCSGHFDMVKFLLVSGAKKDHRDNEGKTALDHLTSSKTNTQIIELLQQEIVQN